MSSNFSEKRFCPRCKQEKLIDEFYKSNLARCKSCQKEYGKQYYKKYNEKREVKKTKKPGVYFIMDAFGYVKIGYASDFHARVATIQTSNSHPVVVIALFFTEKSEHEILTHLNYIHNNIGLGEWFLLSQEELKEIYDMMDEEEIERCIQINKTIMDKVERNENEVLFQKAKQRISKHEIEPCTTQEVEQQIMDLKGN